MKMAACVGQIAQGVEVDVFSQNSDDTANESDFAT